MKIYNRWSKRPKTVSRRSRSKEEAEQLMRLGFFRLRRIIEGSYVLG